MITDEDKWYLFYKYKDYEYIDDYKECHVKLDSVDPLNAYIEAKKKFNEIENELKKSKKNAIVTYTKIDHFPSKF